MAFGYTCSLVGANAVLRKCLLPHISALKHCASSFAQKPRFCARAVEKSMVILRIANFALSKQAFACLQLCSVAAPLPAKTTFCGSPVQVRNLMRNTTKSSGGLKRKSTARVPFFVLQNAAYADYNASRNELLDNLYVLLAASALNTHFCSLQNCKSNSNPSFLSPIRAFCLIHLALYHRIIPLSRKIQTNVCKFLC